MNFWEKEPCPDERSGKSGYRSNEEKPYYYVLTARLTTLGELLLLVAILVTIFVLAPENQPDARIVQSATQLHHTISRDDYFEECQRHCVGEGERR